MDGYALRLADAQAGRVDVETSVLPGAPAPALSEGKAVRIMTGAVVPAEAELVIRREDVEEHDDHIVVGPNAKLEMGVAIRRRGENSPADTEIVGQGELVTPGVMAGIASYGSGQTLVRRRVRVATVITGDELLTPGSPAEDWQIRDSNGPALNALLAPVPWIDYRGQVHTKDDYESLLSVIQLGLKGNDALFVTGGVSMGTHDFVPAAMRATGCEVIFHKLPQRPGFPLLGAIGPEGQLVLGLPGNPLAVMCSARRIGIESLARRAGLDSRQLEPARVTLDEHDGKSLGLWWNRPVRVVGDGIVRLTPSKGSGDLVSAARSDGFVEIPPDQTSVGPYPFYTWNV
jgi:molybdopterin molybdotransferase